MYGCSAQVFYNSQHDLNDIPPARGRYTAGHKNTAVNKLGESRLQKTRLSIGNPRQLYLNDNLIGETLSAPYIISLNKQYKGVAELTIQVYDNAGNMESITQQATIYNLFGN